MEMRSLSRCLLRSRPTSSLLFTTRQATLFHGPRSLRYASTNNSPSTEPQSPSPSSSSRPPRKSPQSPSAGIDQILNELNLSSTRRTIPDADGTSAAARPGRSFGADSTSATGLDAISLSRAAGQSAISSQRQNVALPVRKVELKLGPTLGRQVFVEPERGVDLAAALRSLQTACAVNRVRQQSNAQKFHVRRGQMKKNLRIERWRRLFKFSFSHTVSKIQRMREQGW